MGQFWDLTTRVCGEEATPLVREIYVPLEGLNQLLPPDAERVFLSRDEYERMLALARRQAPTQPPIDASILAAEYRAEIRAGRALIVGTVDAEVWTEGWQRVPLKLSGVGLRGAFVNGQPAPLGREKNDQVDWFVQGKGRHRLELQLTVPLRSTAAQQTLELELPTPPATRFQVTVAGDVEVRSGAAVIRRELAPAGDETNLELLLERGPVSLVLSLNNRQRATQPLTIVRGLQLAEVTQAYQRLHATLSWEVRQGALTTARLALPDRFEVTSVTSAELARWVELPANESQPRRVELTFREPQTGTVLVHVLASQDRPFESDWQWPRLTPLDVATESSILGLLLEERLVATQLTSERLIPIDWQVLGDHLPETITQSAAGEPRLRPLVAYYAPSAEYQLKAQVELPAARLTTVSNQLWTLAEERVTVRGGLTLTPLAEPILTVDLIQPAGWTVEEVTTRDGQPLPFELLGSDVQPGDPLPARDRFVRIPLSRVVAPGESFELRFRATTLPAGWLSDWQEQRLRFPTFVLKDVESDRGAIAVQVSDEYEVEPLEIVGLEPLTGSEKENFGLVDVETRLAYRYETRPVGGELMIRRLRPWSSARVLSWLRIRPQGLSVESELHYSIRRARRQQLEFSLPLDTPASITIEGRGGVVVKESRQREEAGFRFWTVLLDQPRWDEITIVVTWTQALPKEAPANWALPLARAEQVQYQSARVAIEGSPELDVRLSTSGRRVDVGELADASFVVGARLLGAYGFDDPTALILADVTPRTGYGLPEVLVERAELVTRCAERGLTQNAARYLLRTKARLLEMELPASNALRLWSVRMDGVPLAPQRTDDRVLLSLPGGDEGAVRDLQVVYEFQPLDANHGLQSSGNVQLYAPHLWVRGTEELPAYRVPVADVRWVVILPDGQRLIRAQGNVRPSGEADVEPQPASLLSIVMRQSARGAAWCWGGLSAWAPMSRRLATMTAKSAVPMGRVDSAVMESYPGAMAPEGPGGLGGLGGAMAGGRAMGGVGNLPSYDADAAAANVPQQAMPPGMPQPRMAPASESAPGAGEPLMAQPATAPIGPPESSTGAPPARSAESTNAESTKADTETMTVPETQVDGEPFWALQGVRSLPIDLETDGTTVVFQGMPDQPELAITLVPRLPSLFFRWFLAGVMVILIVLYQHASLRVIICRVLATLLVLLIIPTLLVGTVGWELADLFVPAFWIMALAVPIAIASRMVRGVRRLIGVGVAWLWQGRRAVVVPVAIGLVLVGEASHGLAQPASSSPSRGTVPAMAQATGPANPQPGSSVTLPPTTAAMTQPTMRPEADRQEARDDEAEDREWAGPPVVLPENAVIIPYEGDDPTTARNAQHVLVPYETYLRLWRATQPELSDAMSPLTPAQGPGYALGQADYRVALSENDAMTVVGQLYLDVFVERPIEVPLAMRAAVLTRALLQGQPARISVVMPEPKPVDSPERKQTATPQAAVQQPIGAAANLVPTGSSLAVPSAAGTESERVSSDRPANHHGHEVLMQVQVPGRGRWLLELSWKLPLERRGGWRVVDSVLPVAPANKVSVLVPEAKTELRWFDVADREEYETRTAGESVETALGSAGRLHLQWRPQVAVSQLAQSVTARSQAVVMLGESGVRLAWDLQIDLGLTPRDSVVVQVPEGYQIETIAGDNLRGWKALAEPSGRVEVTLLQATAGQERLRFVLSKNVRLDEPGGANVSVPMVGVPGSVLHQGSLSIQRSPWLEVETLAVRGVTREDVPATLPPFVDSNLLDTPLGHVPYQAFRFQADTFSIELKAVPAVVKREAKIEAIASLGRQELRYEARILLRETERPWYQLRVQLPVGFQLEKVDGVGRFQTAISTSGSAPVLSVFQAVGQRQAWSLVVTGRLAQSTQLSAFNAPVLQLLDGVNQRGQLVVQTDPAWEVVVMPQRHCRVVPLGEVRDWYHVSRPELNRVVVAFDQADYAAQLQPRMLPPRVDVVTVSNARVTPTEIEDSLLLKFQISQAGIREVHFLVPAAFQDAQVQAPLLRRTRIEPVEGQPELRRFRLELQDDITGEWLVLVKLDRAVSTEQQVLPLITVEDVRSQTRFAVLENVGRDELVVQEMGQVEALNREDPRWGTLADWLGEKMTQAFIVSRDAESPRLVYQAVRRPVRTTVGASIRLAETKLSMDAAGVYRALQLYRLDNQTEQVLDVELPAGAQLWTARVAGQPVKPAVSQDTTVGRIVRIPLVKTEPGDLDYPVELKYGGRIAAVGTGARFNFPLMRPVGIKMEQSQIRLWVAEEVRCFAFDGTLRRVTDEGELLAGYVAYRNRQIESLLGVLQSGGASGASPFSKIRAATNLKQLEVDLQQDLATGYSSFNRNTQLQNALQTNRSMLEDAERRLSESSSELTVAEASDHRARLEARFWQQQPQRASGYLTTQTENFPVVSAPQTTSASEPPASQTVTEAATGIDAAWLGRFRKTAPEIANRTADGRVIELGKEVVARQAGERIPAKDANAMPQWEADAKQAGGLAQAKAESGEQRKSELQLQFDRYQSQLEQRSRTSEPAVADSQRGSLGADVTGRTETLREESDRTEANRDLRRDDALMENPVPAEQEELAEPLADVIADRGLASLDVEIPQRGRAYLFTTPGGDVELEARALELRPLEHLGQVLVLLVGLVVVGVFSRSRSQRENWTGR
jgi:hypothetical protein